MIAAALEKKQPGFYFIVSSSGAQVIFYTAVSPSLVHAVDMKQFATWLSTQGLRGGGPKNSIQGGGEKYNPQLGNAIKQWLQENK